MCIRDRLYFVGYFFAGFNIVAAGYLSATNRPVEASVTSICRGMVDVYKRQLPART